MTPEFFDNMKERLKEDKARLEEELSRTNFEDVGDGEGENAYEVAQYGDKLSLEEALRKALRDVDSSLKRMKEKTYGTCKYCKEDITQSRLNARPTSSACIKCKKTLTQEM
jgi:DnaK suppressor protein